MLGYKLVPVAQTIAGLHQNRYRSFDYLKSNQISSLGTQLVIAKTILLINNYFDIFAATSV